MLPQFVAVLLVAVLLCVLCVVLHRLYSAVRLGASPLKVGAVALVALLGWLAVLTLALGQGGGDDGARPGQQPAPSPVAVPGAPGSH
jgi:hypothetical protein